MPRADRNATGQSDSRTWEPPFSPSTASTEGPNPKTLPRLRIVRDACSIGNMGPSSLAPGLCWVPSSRVLPILPETSWETVASGRVYDVFGATDTSTFRNHLPLIKASQAQEEESGGQLLPPMSTQCYGEASLQVNRRLEPSSARDPYLQPDLPISVGKEPPTWGLRGQHPLLSPPQATLLGLAALSKAFPEVLTPGGIACVTPTSPWPRPLPWPWRILDKVVSTSGAKHPGALLLEALRSPGLRALEAGTATELLDVFSGLEANGEELAEAMAAGNPGSPLPSRAAELREALDLGPRGLALRLWPKLQVVVTLDAGGQTEAVAALEALWCHGLAFFSPAYAASGGQQESGLVSCGAGGRGRIASCQVVSPAWSPHLIPPTPAAPFYRCRNRGLGRSGDLHRWPQHQHLSKGPPPPEPLPLRNQGLRVRALSLREAWKGSSGLSCSENRGWGLGRGAIP